MAHFAEIDGRNIVQRVIVIPDEQEHRGQEYIAVDLNLGGRWLQTSYSGTLRGKYASAGDFYDEGSDEFISAYLRKTLRAGQFHFGLAILTFENGIVRVIDFDDADDIATPVEVMVNTLISQLPTRDRIKFEKFLEYTPDFHINHPDLLMMAAALGMTQENLETFFTLAENPDYVPPTLIIE